VMSHAAFRVGRSRRVEYGGEPVDVAIAQEYTNREVIQAASWQSVVWKDIANNEIFAVLLLSDAIVADSITGAESPAALRQNIEALFARRATVVGGIVETAIAGGFNSTWRLALPDASAARAGSVVILRANESISLTDIVALEAPGLGERLTEGFGRWMAVFPAQSFYVGRAPEPAALPRPENDIPLTGQLVQRRLLDDLVDFVVLRAAAAVIRGATELPSPSLISRLRRPLRAGAAGLSELHAMVKASTPTLRQRVMDRVQRCQLPAVGKHLDEWLYDATAPNTPIMHGLDSVLQTTSLEAYLLDIDSAYVQSQKVALHALVQPRLIDAILAQLSRAVRRARR